MERYQDALNAYNAAIRQDPTIGEIYRHLGDVHEKLRQADDCVSAYQTYLQLTPAATDKAQVEEKIRQCRHWTSQAAGKEPQKETQSKDVQKAIRKNTPKNAQNARPKPLN
jgi:tetratricopeptide (TPR) repeat protein